MATHWPAGSEQARVEKWKVQHSDNGPNLHAVYQFYFSAQNIYQLLRWFIPLLIAALTYLLTNYKLTKVERQQTIVSYYT